MSTASNWAHGIGQNLASNVVVVALGAAGVMLGKSTPLIAQFAPLSYLLTFLVVVLLGLAVAHLSLALWRRFATGGDASPRHDDTEIRGEIFKLDKRIMAVTADHARILTDVSEVASRVIELEGIVSRREAIIADAERREERSATSRDAVARYTLLQEGKKKLDELWNDYSADPHRKGHGAVESALGQFYHDCEQLIGLPPRPFPQGFKPDPSAHLDFRPVSDRMNKMGSGDAKEFEQAYTRYKQYQAAADGEEKAIQQVLRENAA